MSISGAPAMRRRSRRQNMLQEYELEASTSLRLVARSEQHGFAHMRMRREDVQALRLQPGAICSPITALFTTRDAREPLSLRPSETLYVQLPADTEADTEAEAEAETEAEAKTSAEAEAKTDATKTETTAEKVDPKQRFRAARRRAASAWTPLRLVAHHSYVAGMHVSGIMHRAIVRLEFDKQ
jgi:hypothetical protein